MIPGFSFLAGLIFGTGLCLSGMIEQSKVLGFLDLAGRWDPSLAFVIGGAISVGIVAFSIAGESANLCHCLLLWFRKPPYAASRGKVF